MRADPQPVPCPSVYPGGWGRWWRLAPLALALPAAAQEPYDPPIAAASGEPAGALAELELAEGLEASVFAAEPSLANPVAFYVDHAGDVYVAESFRVNAGVTDMREHMDWLDEDIAARTVADRVAMMARHLGDAFDEAYNTHHDRVRLLRDTDGDGAVDHAGVFADGFKTHATGIGAGVLSYRGNVYFTCIPDLWLLRDTDGDGVSDERESLHTGYGVHIALLGHDLHGLRIGPDRRLYFSLGDRSYHVETEGRVIADPESGAIFRCELDGSRLEVVHTGLRNPQELVFDDFGNLWTGDNNSDGGDQARWVNVVEGGDSGWRYPYQWIDGPMARGPWNDEKLWHPQHEGQAAYIVPPIANLGHGPSGLTYYPGTGLAPEYARHFFLCDFRGDAAYSGIHTFTVEPDGAFWKLGPVEPFVWNTLATDCDFGPDGRFYISDWVHGWTQTGKGRIFRVSSPEFADTPLVASVRAALAAGFTDLDLDVLQALLGHVDRRLRQEAHFELAARGDDGIARLAEVASARDRTREALHAELRTDDARLPRLHAIWGLGVAARGGSAEAVGAVLPLVSDAELEVRAQALRVLGELRVAAASGAVVAALSDPEPRVRFFAALAAGRLGVRAALGALERLLDDAGESDPNLRHAAVMGLSGIANDTDLDRLAGSASRHVRMGALLVLRRRADPGVARYLADPEPLLVLEAARAIHDLPIDAALPALADLVLPEAASTALARRVMNARLRVGDGTRLVAAALRTDLAPALRSESIEMLARWSDPAIRDLVTNSARPYSARPIEELRPLVLLLVEGGFAACVDELVPSFARLVERAGAREYAGMLIAWVEDEGRATAARVAALEALEPLGAPGHPALVRAALGDADGELRAAALDALTRLAPEEALPSLPRILASGETSERRAALRILGATHTPEANAMLADVLARHAMGLLGDELALDVVLAVEASGDDGLAAGLASAHSVRDAGDPELAPWLDALEGGDPSRGQRVFQRVDLSCVRCHRTTSGPTDGPPAIGPDLAGVTRRLTRQQIAESILAPNRRTTPGFGATVLFLVDGSIASGRVIEESRDAIRLIDSEGEITTVALEDVDERRPDLSAMPERLGDSLEREELRDLIAYLATL